MKPPKKEDAYSAFYQSDTWKKIRAFAMKNLPDRCDICGLPGTNTVHHVVERRAGGSDDISNLRRVHFKCHNREHGNRGSSGGHIK